MHAAKLVGAATRFEYRRSVAGVNVNPAPVWVKLTGPVNGPLSSTSPLKNVRVFGRASNTITEFTSVEADPVLDTEIVYSTSLPGKENRIVPGEL